MHLEEIAQLLGNWKAAIVYLGLSEADEDEVKEENSRVDARRRAVLRKWRAKYGPTATFRTLAKCFYNGGKAEMVEKICKVLQPTPRPAPQYQLTPKYKPAPPHPPPLWYYPPQLGVMYQQPPLPGLQAVAGVTTTFARADISRHVDDPLYHGDISSWEAEKSRSQHTLYTKYEGAVKPTQAKPRGSRKANPSQNKAVAGVTSTFARADTSRHVDDPWYHGDISSWEAEKSRSQHTLYTKYEGTVKPTQAKPRGSRKADPSQNQDDPWYHGDISSWEAEKRLTAKVSDCFLVRKSQSQPGNYTLSVKCEGVVKHFLVRKEHGCYEVDATETAFKSLEELVDYYKHHRLSAKGEKLTTPCLNPGVVWMF